MDDPEASQLMEDAQAAERQGKLDVATQRYQQILSKTPDHPPASFCLGKIRIQEGDLAGGKNLCERAISISPDEPVYRLHFAAVLTRFGENDTAIVHARKACELMPSSPIAFQILGACFFAAGRFEEATMAARSEIALVPNSLTAHWNLASTQLHLSQTKEACETLERVIQIDPAHFDARLELARGYLKLSRPAQAIQHSSKAIALRPTSSFAQLLHGMAAHGQKKLDAAASSFERCTKLDPQLWDGFFLLGETLAQARRWPAASRAYAKAHRLRPADIPGLDGLTYSLRNAGDRDQLSLVLDEAMKCDATVPAAMAARAELLCDQDQWDEAILLTTEVLKLESTNLKATLVQATALGSLEHHQAAIDLLRKGLINHPDSPAIRFNLGLLRLATGDIGGWADFEYRHEIPGLSNPYLLQPEEVPKWDGSDLAGKSLLIFQEQGFGDFIQCMRAIPQLAKRAKSVVVFVFPAVASVIPRVANVTVATSIAEIPRVDFQVGDMSLPCLLQWSPTEQPSFGSYVAEPSADLLSYWRKKLEHLRGFRIGIAWSGSPTHPHHHRRIIPLASLSSLAKMNGVDLVSLQFGEIGQAGFPIFDPSPQIKTFSDTAAIIRQLDLVITVDTSIAHLAGAMNAPVWLMLPKLCDFRWLLDRDTSPWYPSMRLFRQRKLGDWQPVIDGILQALNAEKIRNEKTAGDIFPVPSTENNAGTDDISDRKLSGNQSP